MTEEKMIYHEQFMKEAIEEALYGSKKYDEVPVGAVIVKDGVVIAKAHNEKEKTGYPTKHAEILAIERAVEHVGDWRLSECDMYTTLEPCPMCCGAMLTARMTGVYFGAYDKKAGACTTLFELLTDPRLNHRVDVLEGGIMKKECADILSDYFKTKRSRRIF